MTTDYDSAVLRDETVAEAVRARLAGDERRAEDRDRLQRLVESVTQPRGTYRPVREVMAERGIAPAPLRVDGYFVESPEP